MAQVVLLLVMVDNTLFDTMDLYIVQIIFWHKDSKEIEEARLTNFGLYWRRIDDEIICWKISATL